MSGTGEILSFRDMYEAQVEDPALSLLYPTRDASDGRLEERASPIEEYAGMPVRPFIRKIDLNAGEEYDVRPCDAWLAGVEIDF